MRPICNPQNGTLVALNLPMITKASLLVLILLLATSWAGADENRRYARALAIYESEMTPLSHEKNTVVGDWELADVAWIDLEALFSFPFPNKPSRRNYFISTGPMPFSLSFKEDSQEGPKEVTLQIKEKYDSLNPKADLFPAVKIAQNEKDLIFSYADLTYQCRHGEVLLSTVLTRSQFKIPVGIQETIQCKVLSRENSIGFLGFTKVTPPPANP